MQKVAFTTTCIAYSLFNYEFVRSREGIQGYGTVRHAIRRRRISRECMDLRIERRCRPERLLCNQLSVRIQYNSAIHAHQI
jgi:hypothetical protein